jgi:murein DD-endopeptidase MepM/ murein hydrolase activator NlpD
MTEFIQKQLLLKRPVAYGIPVSMPYGARGTAWDWHLDERGLWRSGQWEGQGNHPGVDFAAPEGTVVTAMADGYISRASWQAPRNKREGLGLMIRQIIALSRWTLVYGHLSHVLAKPGARVKKGERIALTGATGNVDSPVLHCHLEDPDGQYHELFFDGES